MSANSFFSVQHTQPLLNNTVLSAICENSLTTKHYAYYAERSTQPGQYRQRACHRKIARLLIERSGIFFHHVTVLHAGKNIRNCGEDVTAGVTILDAGIKLRPQDLGLAASIGVAQLPVYRLLRVAIFCTGDELTEPNTVLGAALAPGKIYNANRYTLTGLLHALHCEVIDFGIVPDNLAATRTVLAAAAQQSDLIITSGGVSVGDEDHVKAAVEAQGHLEMWRIAMKPGKPLAFGSVGNSKKNGLPTPLFGLPGNPVSVFATFCLFARPFILRCQGMAHTLPQPVSVRADFDWLQSGNRREYLRARLSTGVDGVTGAVIYPNQSSAALTSVSWAHGLICIAEGTTVQRGQMVSFIPFTELLA